MKITMNGKYAYRKDPRKQIKVLCVDRKNAYPVVVLGGADSDVSTHTKEGMHCSLVAGQLDLVPLDETLKVTLGIYRMRDCKTAAICYIRPNAAAGFVAIGWCETGTGTFAESWRLDGRYSMVSEHGFDLVERVGDLP